MSVQILGISGSPVLNSNTDRLVLQVLQASGVEYEFVKLSKINVGPCRACKACVQDNICKVEDDFPELAKKLRLAKGLVIGGYIPYGMLDAFTKSFLERLWSMRHLNSLNEQKYVVTIISGLNKQARELALKLIAVELSMEKMHHVAQLSSEGNAPCLTCGYSDQCQNSSIPYLFSQEAKAAQIDYIAVEDQPIWEKAAKVGNLLGQFITEEIECWLDY